jgi:hypothetical protein
MSKGNPFLALRLAPETMECLRETSARQGRSVSDMAREALARGLMPDPATARGSAAVTQDAARVAARLSRPRRRSRVQRVSTIMEDLQCLLAEYEDWRASIPEFAEGSATTDKLDAAVEALATVVEALEDVDLPRGYGRD